MTIFNTLVGLQQIGLLDTGKDTQEQNIMILEIRKTKNFNLYVTNYIATASMITSSILLTMINSSKFLESLLNVQIVRSGYSTNSSLIIVAAVADLTRKFYTELVTEVYIDSKL